MAHRIVECPTDIRSFRRLCEDCVRLEYYFGHNYHVPHQPKFPYSMSNVTETRAVTEICPGANVPSSFTAPPLTFCTTF